MKLVLNSNIFIAALLKDGKIREIIVNFTGELFYPEIIFEEIKKHEDELLAKSTLSAEEFYEIIGRLIKYVTIIPTEKIKPFKDEAFEIIGSIDKDDVPFIATSIALGHCPIWSDDKVLKQQNRIKVYSTEEIIRGFFQGE